jgi:hypothetical protein
VRPQTAAGVPAPAPAPPPATAEAAAPAPAPAPPISASALRPTPLTPHTGGGSSPWRVALLATAALAVAMLVAGAVTVVRRS